MSMDDKPGDTAETDLEMATDALLEANPPEDAPEPDARIVQLEAEKEELRGQLLRVLADLDNTRKRTERQVTEARVYGIEKFAADLLSVSDNLSRALGALPEGERDTMSDAGRNLLGGIEMTAKELTTALTRHGVTPIEALPGAPFDPNLHQAVAQIPSAQAAGAIAECFQPGWRIGDRVLRAAMVAVSAGGLN